MTTDDDRISKRYRELPREEPSRHVDEAILAAARRAAHTRPAPLVVPSGRQRWYFPLAAAAIIVLAVAVTVHMEREQPAEEIVSTNSVTASAPAREAHSAPRAADSPPAKQPAPAAAPSAPAPASSGARGFELRDQAANEERAKRDTAPLRTEPQPRFDLQAPPPRLDLQVPPPAPPAELQKRREAVAADSVGAIAPGSAAERRTAAAAAPAPQASSAPLRRAEEGARKVPALSAAAVQSPEQWLQGIADLRSQGYHDEADRQLAEFRKRYPEYRIPEAMLRKVERPAR